MRLIWTASLSSNNFSKAISAKRRVRSSFVGMVFLSRYDCRSMTSPIASIIPHIGIYLEIARGSPRLQVRG